uniref:hypothetical protein n=1 Tax=Okeania sp. SIO2F4 TaxID=2607790 RepID=UPI0025DCFE50
IINQSLANFIFWRKAVESSVEFLRIFLEWKIMCESLCIDLGKDIKKFLYKLTHIIKLEMLVVDRHILNFSRK